MNVRTMLWKEVREAYLRKGRPSPSTWAGLGLVALLGLGGPVFIATVTTDPEPMLAAFASVAYVLGVPLFVGLVSPQALIIEQFAGERERHTLETLLAGPLSDRAMLWGKMLVPVLAAAAVALLVVSCGGLVFLAFWGAPAGFALLFVPLAPVLAAALALPLTAVGAAIGARAASVKAGQQVYGLAILPLFLLPQFGFLFATGAVAGAVAAFGDAAGVAALTVIVALAYAIVTGSAIVWADRRFRRHRLLA